MTSTVRRTGRAAVAAMLLTAGIGQAAVVTFDTDTTTTAETQATYGFFLPNFLDKAVVTGGELRLYSLNAAQNSLAFGRFDGDVQIEFDTRIAGPAGSVNVGFHTEGMAVFIHPGYWDSWFGPSSPSGRLGFVPDPSLPTHFSVHLTAATQTFDVSIANGGRVALFSFVDPGYRPGLSALGLSSGMVIGAGYYAAFDNLSVTTVPEPATAALWGLGGLALAAAGRRRRMAMLGLAAALPAGAAVTPLYDERLDGDLSGVAYSLSPSHQVFSLGAGVSTVKGMLRASGDPGGFQTDVDAFELLLNPGYEITAVSVQYLLSTGNFGGGVVQHLWRPDAALPASRAEYKRIRGAGSEPLFDAGAPFSPVAGNGRPGVFWVQLADPGFSGSQTWTYDYEFAFTVAAVPEPASAALVALALGSAGWARRRR